MSFSDLRADPLAVTRQVYEAFGLDWTADARAAIEEIDREAKSGKAAPSHSYRLEDYGLTEAEVRAAFDR